MNPEHRENPGILENPDRYWFARHSKSIIFFIAILTVIGVWQAFTLPVAVFPTTNFPRIIIGVDNGVTPIEQMEVTITRPLEDAVRSVPGLEDVRSVTSRGSTASQASPACSFRAASVRSSTSWSIRR